MRKRTKLSHLSPARTLSDFLLPIGEMFKPWQPFLGEGMASRDLNNEDYFSNYSKRLPSFDALFRAQSQFSPEHFFRNLARQSGGNHCGKDDYQRAIFLFRRLQSARRIISKLSLVFVAVSLVPFAWVALPEEWRFSVFTSGIVLEFFAGAILYFAHSRWQARCRDYCLWLRLVHRRVSGL
jgi:hypothetical protein